MNALQSVNSMTSQTAAAASQQVLASILSRISFAFLETNNVYKTNYEH
jgi:hypothetical protein